MNEKMNFFKTKERQFSPAPAGLVSALPVRRQAFTHLSALNLFQLIRVNKRKIVF
jgi:hypothetical protein